MVTQPMCCKCLKEIRTVDFELRCDQVIAIMLLRGKSLYIRGCDQTIKSENLCQSCKDKMIQNHLKEEHSSVELVDDV